MRLPRLVLCLLLLGAAGCDVKRYALRQAADTLSETGDSTTFSGDDDPELIRDALPFALKTMESLLAGEPNHLGLLTSLAGGFTQYGYAFVQQDAERIAETSLSEAKPHFDRARKLYRRAHAYALRGLEVKHPGFGALFAKDPGKAVKMLSAADVPLIYWAGASLGAMISISKDRPELIGELPAVGELMSRALALDEDYDKGALHAFMISYESRSESMGGSLERARKHFDRAVELQQGLQASPFVSWAEAYCVSKQDRQCFDEMMAKALAVEIEKAPANRLVNVIAQRRAEWLRSRVEDLILSDEPEEEAAEQTPSNS